MQPLRYENCTPALFRATAVKINTNTQILTFLSLLLLLEQHFGFSSTNLYQAQLDSTRDLFAFIFTNENMSCIEKGEPFKIIVMSFD